VLAVIQDGWKVTEVAERLGVSRQAVHAWIARYQAGGLAALADRSHRPTTCPHQIARSLRHCGGQPPECRAPRFLPSPLQPTQGSLGPGTSATQTSWPGTKTTVNG
jgi:hypothetical protein